MSQMQLGSYSILREFGTKSLIVAPINTYGLAIGYVAFGWVRESKKEFTEADLQVVREAKLSLDTQFEIIEKTCIAYPV